MRVIARYTWGKLEQGYGWQTWEEPSLSIERHGITGQWEILESDGTLLCRCVDYRSAQKVVARLRRLTRAQVTPDAIPDYAIIVEGKDGWTVQRILAYEEPGQVYHSREEAEARLVH